MPDVVVVVEAENLTVAVLGARLGRAQLERTRRHVSRHHGALFGVTGRYSASRGVIRRQGRYLASRSVPRRHGVLLSVTGATWCHGVLLGVT